jgi:hypothetical protein
MQKLSFANAFRLIEADNFAGLNAKEDDVAPYAVYLLQRLRAATVNRADMPHLKSLLLQRVPLLGDILAYADAIRVAMETSSTAKSIDADTHDEEVVVGGGVSSNGEQEDVKPIVTKINNNSNNNKNNNNNNVSNGFFSPAEAAARLTSAAMGSRSASAAMRFENGAADVRVALVKDAVGAVLRAEWDSPLVELLTTPILAPHVALILPLLLRAAPDVGTIEQLAPALLSLPSAAQVAVAAGLLYTVVCNTPNERSLSAVVAACVARLAQQYQQQQQQHMQDMQQSTRATRGAPATLPPTAVELVLMQLLLRLCCLSPTSAHSVVSQLSAAVTATASTSNRQKRADARQSHALALVVMRVKSELLESLIDTSDSWLRSFVRQYQDVGDIAAAWRSGVASSGSSLSTFGSRRRPLSSSQEMQPAFAAAEPVPEWPRFALQERETTPNSALEPASVHALLSVRQLLLSRLQGAATASVAQLAAFVRAYCLLYGVLGARATSDEVSSLIGALNERLARPDASTPALDDVKQLTLCFVLVCEGLTRQSGREQLVQCLRAALYNDTSSLSLLVTANLAAHSESGVADVVRGKLDAPSLSFDGESFKAIGSLLLATVLDERRALAQCLALPPRCSDDPESALTCVYHFLKSGSFARLTADNGAAQFDPSEWVWRLLLSADDVAPGDSMHPLLPAVVDEIVLFAVAARSTGAFSVQRVRAALQAWQGGSVPSARCCLVVYFVLRFNDESRMAHESRVQKRQATASTYARFDDAMLALLPVRAIFRAATQGVAGLSRFLRELIVAIHAPIVGLSARLVAQSVSLASQLDGSTALAPLVVASPAAHATMAIDDGELTLNAIGALVDAPVDVRVRALAPCLAALRRAIVQLHKRRGLVAILSLKCETQSHAVKRSRQSGADLAALNGAINAFVDAVWPVAHDALPSRASAMLTAAFAAPTRGVDRTLGGVALDNVDAVRRDVSGGVLDNNDNDNDDDDDETVQYDADLCDSMCVSDPLAVFCGADRAMLACEPLFNLLVGAVELYLVTSRKHYADSLSMHALVASSMPVAAAAAVANNGDGAPPNPPSHQTTAEHYNRLRDALIGTQESACVGVLAELATGRWIKALFATAGVPLDAAPVDGMSRTVCSLLHRLYCTHPPLLSMSLLHLADPELVSESVDDDDIGVLQRERNLDDTLSVLCERVPSMHAAIGVIHGVVQREKSPAHKLVLCVRLLAHVALLPLYRVPHTLDVCNAVLNRVMHGRGESDVQFFKHAVLCLPALCVAFPTLALDTLNILADLCPTVLRAKMVRVVQAQRARAADDDNAAAQSMQSLLPSAADALLGDAIHMSRKRVRTVNATTAQAEQRARELLADAPRLPPRDAARAHSASERLRALLAHRCEVAFDAIAPLVVASGSQTS